MIILGTNSIKDTGYDVANSVRFNRGDSPTLKRTPSSASNRDTWTWSGWVKRSGLGTIQVLFGATVGNNPEIFYFNSDDTFIYHHDIPGSDYKLISSQVFRDVSAWMHIVVAKDTTQSTETNRLKIYVNGSQITMNESALGYPAQNFDGAINNNTEHTLGDWDTDAGSNSYFLDLYMCEVFFIDGSQLVASSFGEFDSDSPTIWKPKDCKADLTFGTNGFYLDFADSGDLGDDESGNGNDYTEANLAATDQATDTCTNNFCTMNPLIPTSNVTFSEGNCKIVSDASNPMGGAGVGTFGLTAGKWYYEVKIASLVDNHTHGAVSENTTELYTGATAIQNDTGVTSWINGDGGEVVVDGTATTNDYGLYTDGQIMGVALDIDNYNITYLRNGSALVSDFNMSTTRGTIFPLIKTGVNTTSEVNFGGCSAFSISSAQSDQNGYGNFEIAPPSGYLAICSKNLGSDGG